jgi:catechol 2,3-dioxygenase-like lactoylglutathione lyase family enzyme
VAKQQGHPPNVPTLTSAAPVLASLHIERTVSFYCTRLGFSRVYVDPGVWGIVSRDSIQIHFWPCHDKSFAENTSCRVYVRGIDALFAELQPQGVVHPNAPLAQKPWGSREFGVLDLDGNLIIFAERGHA